MRREAPLPGMPLLRQSSQQTSPRPWVSLGWTTRGGCSLTGLRQDEANMAWSPQTKAQPVRGGPSCGFLTMATTGFALHAHSHVLPQRPALLSQPTAGRIPSARWGCAIVGRDAPRIAQREAFQVYATAAVDMAALEAQVKGKWPTSFSTPHLIVFFLMVARRSQSLLIVGYFAPGCRRLRTPDDKNT